MKPESEKNPEINNRTVSFFFLKNKFVKDPTNLPALSVSTFK